MKKNSAIKNEYDGPVKPKDSLLPIITSSIALDYVNSDDAQDLDTGIRETIRGIRLSILGMGIGLAKLKAQGMFADLGYHSMAQYIEKLADDTEGNRIFVGEKLAVTLSEDLDPKTKEYLTTINVEAGEALEAGEVILPIRLYDMDELKRFERAADKLKKDMRINYKGQT